jgi:hypothetical protein
MPIITSLGRGLHTNRGGSGLYTSSDVQRGTTPTPSQVERGVTDQGLDQRWWLLDQAQKQAWQAQAGPGTSGRRYYSTVNRLRLDSRGPTSDEVPASAAGPTAPRLDAFSAYGVSDDSPYASLWANVADYPAGDLWEISLYKPASSPSDPLQYAAHWWFAGMFGWGDGYGQQTVGLFAPQPRGESFTPSVCPTPPTGSTIRCRILHCSADYVPGDLYFTTVLVQPGPPPY